MLFDQAVLILWLQLKAQHDSMAQICCSPVLPVMQLAATVEDV
jgi:hypothetical protein